MIAPGQLIELPAISHVWLAAQGASELPRLVLRFAMVSMMLLSQVPSSASGEEVSSSDSQAGLASQLAIAYQSGFLSVCAAACFQLYSSMGVIASDLAAGHISGNTAVDALDHTSLLLSVCQGSLAEVKQLTDPADRTAIELLNRLSRMLDSLVSLHMALVEAASTPRSDSKRRSAAAEAVEQARIAVESALEQYSAPLQTLE